MLELDLQRATEAAAPDDALFRRWCELALRQRTAASEMTIRLVDEAEARELNHTYRHKDYATNVLSFPSPQGPEANPEGQIGDIALAFGVCQREAIEQGKPFAHHLQHLVAHGVLHLLGYDHEGDEEAESMEALEREILATLDVPDPYAPDPYAPEQG